MKLMNSGELTFLSGGILKLAILFNVSKKFAVLLVGFYCLVKILIEKHN